MSRTRRRPVRCGRRRPAARSSRPSCPYAERALKFAADIVDQNPNFDLYFASKDFVAQFGDRLYVPIDKLGLDTSDYVPITLKQLANNGKTVALPLFADQELFIYNQDYWTEAGLDPAAVPTTWDEMYALTPQADRPQERQAGSQRHADPAAVHVVLAVLLQQLQSAVHQ